MARLAQGVYGCGSHSLPAHLTVILDPAKVKVTPADGKAQEMEPPSGSVFWSEAETHSAENIGTTVSRALLIEV